MQSSPSPHAPTPQQPHQGHATHGKPKAPASKRSFLAGMSRRNRLLLFIGGGIAGVALLALIAINLLLSADWVRDRVAARIKEQTGRELKVNGTTALLFTPRPKVIISDAVITDPEARAGTADLEIGRLVLDLSLKELLSRQIDAGRVVLERPVLTLRLGEDTRPKEAKPKTPKSDVVKVSNPSDKPRREVKLRDVRIKNGTVKSFTTTRAPPGKSNTSRRSSACRRSPIPSPAPADSNGRERQSISASASPLSPTSRRNAQPSLRSASTRKPSPPASTAAS